MFICAGTYLFIVFFVYCLYLFLCLSVYLISIGTPHLSNYSFIHSFIPSFLPSFLPSCIPSFMHSFLHSFVPSFIRSFIPSFLPSFLHSFIPSFIHSFIHSFILKCVVSAASYTKPITGSLSQFAFHELGLRCQVSQGIHVHLTLRHVLLSFLFVAVSLFWPKGAFLQINMPHLQQQRGVANQVNHDRTLKQKSITQFSSSHSLPTVNCFDRKQMARHETAVCLKM